MNDININISGKKWRMVFNSKSSGSWWKYEERKISIGTKVKADIKENIIHECAECILSEHNLRYSKEVSNPDNGDFKFFMNHDEFQNFCRDLSAALEEITTAYRKGMDI